MSTVMSRLAEVVFPNYSILAILHLAECQRTCSTVTKPWINNTLLSHHQKCWSPIRWNRVTWPTP